MRKEEKYQGTLIFCPAAAGALKGFVLIPGSGTLI
jgi:hypothetical protein